MVKAASCKGGRSGATVGLGFYGFATAAAAAARAKVCDSGSRSVAVAGILFGVDRRRDLEWKGTSLLVRVERIKV